ncbi:hypothetical protein PWEIH_12025 [Listeria weihenstephanensis FSL R9-0317]|uniref:Hydrolase n=1 Tax=Listeria weihenstephanensis TaxID=1006155 RepID=A0A1S7FUY8_9LIST|nr:HD family phosphohydrolase [Listeria weihenstephanensis]AQY51189.1 hydrolase [Listeria weihenstephanensis]EUJ36878.1 hypothetical protein PWEIH_12025 [Listeria weihenstephanensis FSL R9-0317]
MKNRKKWIDWYDKTGKRYVTPVILIFFFVVAFVLICQMVKPESYNVKLFEVAEKTIRSPQTIEDPEKTAEEQTKAAADVDDVYVFNRETAQNRESLISSLFAYVTEVNRDAAEKDAANKKAAEAANNATPAPTTLDEKLASLKSKLSKDVSENITSALSNTVLTTLLQMTVKDIQAVEKEVISALDVAMDQSVRKDNLTDIKVGARDTIELSNLPTSYKGIAKTILSYAIVPNEVYSAQQTEDRRKEASANVVPVKILQGQVVVQEGQIIDREIYRQLDLLHLLDQKMPIKQYAGFALLLLSLAVMLYFFTNKQKSLDKPTKNQYMLVFSSVYIIVLLMLLIIRFLEGVYISNISFLFPAAFGPMIIKILLNEKFAFMMTIFTSVASFFVFQSDATAAVNITVPTYILLSGLASIVVLRDYSRRSAILLSGFIVGLANTAFVILLLLISNTGLLTLAFWGPVGYAFLGGVGSFVLGIGMIPLFETVFGMLTTSRLVELSNPNHPLLKKIMMKAPGTYHHSLMVANLAEACADAIGANSLLVRVGCFYHDIGKTLRPPYFVENQLQGINPHDRLTPEQSRDIIIAHTTDGAAILRENHFPQPIIDIALEHHGTTLVKYFYYKAKEENPDVKEANFRYPGPKPHTREIAIINIADSVEAAVRSCDAPTKEKIKAIVDSIIEDRIKDKQYVECDITFQEIEVVRATLCATLNGIYHQRIQYPAEDK